MHGVVGQRGRSLQPFRVLTSQIDAEHIQPHHGLLVTSPERTVIDVARTSSFREGVVVADAAMRADKVSTASLETALLTCSGFPGICRARDVVAFANPLAESVLESLARALFAQFDLPAPKLQVVLGADGQPIGRVDFYWEEYGVVGEADGMGKYKTHDALIAEKIRQERLENAGFVVVRFTWRDIIRAPEQTIARIRRALARATTRKTAA